MKKIFFFFLVMATHSYCLTTYAQISDTLRGQDSLPPPTDHLLGEVTIFTEKKLFESYVNVSRAALQKQNLGQDLPILLNFTPSAVTFSDAGAGIGYTGIRIRGSDPTRINVTINKIPLNDAESQGVFWVNTPDLASSVNNIQVQRGIGESTNGAGAFGATIGLTTTVNTDKPYAELSNSYGSFNTFKHTLQAGTGLLNKYFTFDARLSYLRSEGYIDRASSQLSSWFISGNYQNKKDHLTLNVFSGKETTYQAWLGVPQTIIDTNRTYNFYTYDNQTDNYQQDHYQLLYARQLASSWKGELGVHYTKGYGYFEEYKPADDLFGEGLFSFYGLPDLTLGPDTLRSTDLIRRRWLDNDFYGFIYQLEYKASDNRIFWQLGGGYNLYDGLHYGELIWMRFSGNTQIRERYYEGTGLKKDFNTYSKLSYQITPALEGIVDLQYRRVDYSIAGQDPYRRDISQTNIYNFFNPKVGLKVNTTIGGFYASYRVGHREPTRDDFIQAFGNSLVRPERLDDLEAGWERYLPAGLNIRLNAYWMRYRDQLVLTGRVNDVGAFVRTNVPRSYRLGLEVELSYKITNSLQWNANATFSRNKIQEFTEFVSNFDEGSQQAITYQNTDISFSPSLIASNQLEYKRNKMSIALLSKYVGQQYLDNTQSEQRKLDAYFTNDVRLSYSWKLKFLKELNLSLLVNNIFSTLYEPNGYTFSYISEGQRVSENYYYPQAGINFLAALRIKF